jgi:hypothetical protein
MSAQLDADMQRGQLQFLLETWFPIDTSYESYSLKRHIMQQYRPICLIWQVCFFDNTAWLKCHELQSRWQLFLFAVDSSSTYTFKLSPEFAVSNQYTKMMITSASCALNSLMCGTAWILHTQLNMVTQWMFDAVLASWMCHSPRTAGHCMFQSLPDDHVPVQQSGLKSPQHCSHIMLYILNHCFSHCPKLHPGKYTSTVYHVMQRQWMCKIW